MAIALLLAVAVMASLQSTDSVPFLGGSFDSLPDVQRRSDRLSRQNRPGQFAQLPPNLENQGFDNMEFGSQQGFGNQRPGNQGNGNPRPGNQGFGNQGPANQGFGNQRPGNQGNGNQGFGNQGFGNQGPANQGFGNQRPGNQGQGVGGGNDDDDDVFVFDRPTSGRPRPTPTRTTRPRQTPPRPTPPTTSTSGAPTAGSGTTANPCVNRCPTTGEFNPVCGTDRVTYNNPGKLNCAANCGRSVSLSHYGTCITTTPPSTTTPAQRRP